MLRVTRLRIDKFRNVAPGTELLFHDRRNVLLGLNGSGKTTLLKLISAALLSDFSDFANERFTIEVEWALSEGSLKACLKNETASPSQIRGTPSVSHGENGAVGGVLSIRVECRVGTSKLVFERKDRGWTFDRGDGSGEQPFPVNLSEYQPNLFAILLSQALGHMPQYKGASHYPVRFDEALELFDQIGKTPISAFSSQRDTIWSGELLPRSVRDTIKALPEEKRDPAALSSSKLPFLGAAADAMGFASAEMRLDVLERGSEVEGYQPWKWDGPQFRFYRDDGSFIDQARLSYGQKRLLTFLYYLELNPNSVVADELVNGLHHGWIDLALNEIGDRQAFLTSQNPLLFDCLGFSSPEEVSQQFITCEMQLIDKRYELRWGNLALDDAKRFFDAYRAGIQHVGEILRTKGLW